MGPLKWTYLCTFFFKIHDSKMFLIFVHTKVKFGTEVERLVHKEDQEQIMT